MEALDCNINKDKEEEEKPQKITQRKGK